MANKLVGQNYQTPDLVAKVTGRAKYADDYKVDGMLHARLLTSPLPHARARNIDVSRALALPGAHLFDPSGRGEPFKEWVVVPPDQSDEWEALAMDALRGHAPRWENQDPASSSR